MHKKLIAALLSMVVVFSAITTAHSGDIKGKVIIRSSGEREPAKGLSALYRKPGEHDMKAAPDTTSMQAVVFVQSFPGQPDPRSVDGAALAQKNEMFFPHILPVTVGTTVDFPNRDDIYHNVFSFSKIKTFDLGRYAQGKSKSVTFDKPGIVEVFCEIHSLMHAYIVVVPNNFFTLTGEDGSFVIKDIPPGKHRITVWHEKFPVREITVTVPEQGEVEVNIEF
ncbi:hypothetical protein ACFL6L_00355 [candidate division KSB1 bacterium]